MDLEEKQIARLKQLLTLLEPDNLTKEEFIKSFENVIGIVLKTEKNISDKTNKAIAELKDLFEELESNLETSTNAEISKGIQKLRDIVAKALKEQENGMNFMRDKLRKFAEDKLADEKRLTKEILSQIKIPEFKETILDTSEKLRDKLEGLKGKERLNTDAIDGLEELLKNTKAGTGMYLFGGNRPLQIQEGGTVKDKAARYLNFTGATITRAKDGVVTVAVSAGGGVETPTGTQNGSNKDFTVLHTPLYITFNGQNLYENNGYTLSGLTITLDEAPISTDIIRSHY